MLRQSRFRRAVGGTTSLCFALLTGCYAYVSPDGDVSPAGTQVRLHLSDDGRQSVARQSYLAGAATLQGRIIRSTDDVMVIAIARPAREPFREGSTARDTVRISESHVRSLQEKQLRTGPTAGLFGGIAVGIGLITFLALESQGGGSPGGGGDGGQLRDIGWPIP